MAGTGRGTSGSGKPTRRPVAPRSGGTPRSNARGTSARPGAGPGRSRATASGAVRKAASAQVATERKASRTVLRGVVLATIAVLLAVTLVPTLRSYLRQQGEIDALRGDVGQQRSQVTELQKEQARWNDQAYVMQQARERLKFVKVGEKSYTVIDGKSSAKALPGVAKVPAASSDHPWYGQLWESVRVADAGPAAGSGEPSSTASTGTTSVSK
ncbi:MAG: septum formation initiator family protein [Pedococcus sp.]